MKFEATSLREVFVVHAEPIVDERGLFARTWCRDELAAHGLTDGLSQLSVSFNLRRGTLRGMHYQRAPFEEAKLVRCTRGSIYDVALDLRRASDTFGQSVSVELTADNRLGLFVPEGCAHGFMTLEDASEVLYAISVPYEPSAAAGVRWDDPAFAIQWPAPPVTMSARDASHPLWN